MLIRFWCILLKKFRFCSKILISLTKWYGTELRAIVSNCTPIILKFKTFIYNSNSKIIYNNWMYGGKYPPGAGIFTVVFFWKNTSNYAKLIVEPYICDNLNKIYRLFPLLTTKKIWDSFRNVLKNRLKSIALVHL